MPETETAQFRLRQGHIDDVPSIKAIAEEAYTPYISRIGRLPGPMLDDYEKFAEMGFVHILEQQGVVKGFLVLIPKDDMMLLDNVAVAPSAQGQGLGRRLLDFAEDSAIRAGYRHIELYTNEAMVENIKLYSALGYTETRRVEERGLRRVYMVKCLTEP